MRKYALSLVLISSLALAGCAAPEVGVFNDPSKATNALVDKAMGHLGELPVLEYEGAVDEITGGGQPASVEIDVVDDGTAYGTATVGEYEIQMMTVDGVLYVMAPKEFWISEGVDEAYAKSIDGKWTQVDPNVWLDPGKLLTPLEYSEALHEAMEKAGALDVALPEPQVIDGVNVYQIPVGDGFVLITVDEPHVVIAVTNVEISTSAEPGGTILTVDVAGTDGTDVEELLEAMQAALEKMTTIYDNGADLVLSESSPEFDCENSGSCKFGLKVKAEMNGEYHIADSVKLSFKATADGGALGTKKCSKSKTIDIGETASFSCSVKFSVPADGVTYQIMPEYVVTGVATFKPDTDAILEALETYFAEILERY